jgi:hypothetical protein
LRVDNTTKTEYPTEAWSSDEKGTTMIEGATIRVTSTSGVVQQGKLLTLNGSHLRLLVGTTTFIIPFRIIQKVEVL